MHEEISIFSYWLVTANAPYTKATRIEPEREKFDAKIS